MEETKAVSIGRIFYVAFRRWKLFVPVALGVALAGALAIVFLYNPSRGSYTSTFSYTAADLREEKYADGSYFSYTSLISKENLNKVKASDEKYASINVDGLVDSGRISITKGVSDATSNKEAYYTYTINASMKYFKSFEIASSFINDVANLALANDENIINNFPLGKELANFNNFDSFEGQINSLDSVAKTLDSLYGQVVDSKEEQPFYIYSMAYEYQKNLHNSFSSRNVTSLNSEITKYGFVKDYTNLNLEQSLLLLNQEKIDNNKALQVYTDQISSMGGGAAITTLPDKVSELTDRNAEIEQEIESVQAKIDNKPLYDGKDADYMAKYNAFVGKLNNSYQVVNNEVNNYKSFLTAAYVEKSEVDFETSNVIKSKGAINTAIAVVLSLFAGVVVGAAVNLIVDRKKLIEY